MKMLSWLGTALLTKFFVFISLANAADQINTYDQSINRQIYISNSEEKLRLGHYQEAAWILDMIGLLKKSEEITDSLEMIFLSEPVSEETWARGVAKSVLLTFHDDYKNTVKGLFKPTSADPYCASCKQGKAVAVYELDRALGFYLTPLTKWHEFTPQTQAVCEYLDHQWFKDEKKCETIRGSIQYFLNNVQTAKETLEKNINYKKTDKFHFFDAIIGNSDRHLDNILLDEMFREIAIDHNRTFMYTKEEYVSDHRSCWEAEIDKIIYTENLTPYITKYMNMTSTQIRDILTPHIDEKYQRLFMEFRQAISDRLLYNLVVPPEDSIPFAYNVCPTKEVLAIEYID